MAARALTSRINSIVKITGSTSQAAHVLGVSQRTVQRAVKAYNEGQDYKSSATRGAWQERLHGATREAKETRARIEAGRAGEKPTSIIERLAIRAKNNTKTLADWLGVSRRTAQRMVKAANEGKEIIKSDRGRAEWYFRMVQALDQGVISGRMTDAESRGMARELIGIGSFWTPEDDQGARVLVYLDEEKFNQEMGETKFAGGPFGTFNDAYEWIRAFGAGPEYFCIVMHITQTGKIQWSVYDVRGPGGKQDPEAEDKAEYMGDLRRAAD